MDDPIPTPLLTPPLRGRLTMAAASSANLLKDMVHLLGGIRFRQMALFDVGGVWLWTAACA